MIKYHFVYIKYIIENEYWNNISSECKDLILKLLTFSEEDRLSAD